MYITFISIIQLTVLCSDIGWCMNYMYLSQDTSLKHNNLIWQINEILIFNEKG